MRKPIVQIALDVTSVEEAAALGRSALAAGADWLEIGNPLVEFVGINGLDRLIAEFPNTYFLMDAMILAGAEKYLTAAKQLGIQNITVTALAPRETVAETIAWGKKLDIAVTVDLFNTPDKVDRSLQYQDLGADYLMVHFGTDEKRRKPQGSPLDELREVVERVSIPVSYATYDENESKAAVMAGAAVIVQGEPLLHASNPRAAFERFITETKVSEPG